MIDDLLAIHGLVFQRRPGVLYVGDPAIAKAVLANTDKCYREHSDFFHTSMGVFGPRPAQLQVGQQARAVLRRHHERRLPELAASVATVLGPVSEWPDAGNLLLYRHFRDALVGAAPAGLGRLIDVVVRHAVLAGARERRSPLARAVLRSRVRRALMNELVCRRGTAAGADVLDAVAGAVPGGASRAAVAQLAEVFLSCVFAVAGSMGFLLGWAVYLQGGEDADPADVVREALRLWPVAWLFGRFPARQHDLRDFRVTPGDEVVVCSYLVHRDARHWPDPEVFRPQRWSGGTPDGGAEAFIPFGWGPHSCAAAGLAMRAVADVLRRLPPAERRRVEIHQPRPHVAAALAPPAFTLYLS